MNNLTALVTLSLFAGLLLAACGDDGEDVSTTGSPTATAPDDSPTAIPDDSPSPSTTDGETTQVGPNDDRAVAAVNQPGFSEFAMEFERNVEENDLEYFVDTARFEDYECIDTGGFPAEPASCEGEPAGTVVQAINYRLWGSDARYFSPEEYEAFIRERMAGDSSPDAFIFALGDHVPGPEESEEGLAFLVTNVAGPGPDDGPTVTPGAAIVFRVAEADGEWGIVALKQGSIDLIDGFFEWWLPWDEAPFVAPELRALP